MDEYRVKVTVRNNLLLSAIENAGYKTLTDFSKACDLSPQEINNYSSLRKPPINSHGEFTDTAKIMMEVLGACPSELWSDNQLTMRLKKNSGERTVSENAIGYILENHIEMMTLGSPEDDAMKSDLSAVVKAALDTLTPREYVVIKERFTDDLSFAEIGESQGISSERVRQIEAKVFRKFRSENTDNKNLREYA